MQYTQAREAVDRKYHNAHRGQRSQICSSRLPLCLACFVRPFVERLGNVGRQEWSCERTKVKLLSLPVRCSIRFKSTDRL